MMANAEKQALRPWHHTLALWLAQEVEKPTADQVRTEAQRITNKPIPRELIKKLLANPAFQALKLELEENELAQAKQKMTSAAPKMVQHHLDAVDALMAGGNYRDVYKYTNPFLERIWPDGLPERPPSAVININLGHSKFVSAQQGKLENAVDVTAIAEVTVEENEA